MAGPSKVPSDFHLLSEEEQKALIARDFEPEKKEKPKKAPAKKAATKK